MSVINRCGECGEKAKVDRIACPWLISRFVDKDAVFLFVPKGKVIANRLLLAVFQLFTVFNFRLAIGV